jgi:phosphomannomutase
MSETKPRALKAVLLAGGKNPDQAGEPILLQPLGDKLVIDHMLYTALQFVPMQDLYIVVGFQQAELKAHLGEGYQYVVQEQPLGTGHAVLQLLPLIKDYTGDLLILYGDTPLFQAGSIRGLLNRHRLRQADLTLLTAVVDQPLPYGHILRASSGQIIDIVEEQFASAEMRKIRELNMGAYVANAPRLFATLKKLAKSEGEIRLTDCAYQMIRAGLNIESYQIVDQEEVLGVNTPDDLHKAEFILQKRLYRPRRIEAEDEVSFGTGGWRAVIGEGFTLHNVRRLCQALANEVTRLGTEKQGVLVGYDRRFLSDFAAEAAAEVFAGNNIPVILLNEDAPTPLITYATALEKCAYGLAFTASHNPPEWNGLKVFHSDGSLLLDDETRRIEIETNRLTATEVVKLDLEIALQAGVVQKRDYTNEYVDAVEKFIDLEAIRQAGLRVIVDPMYGVGQLTLGIILNEARCRVTFINERRNPLFGGRSPAPNLEAMRLLITYIREYGYDLGLAMDGDADRIAIVDETGEYIEVNDILLLLYWYLHEVRGERGGVVRNLATTHLLDRLCKRLGENCYEVPVGFKHIAAGMIEHNALLGGESSGGVTIRGHILGKDGIFACALFVEMLAKTDRKISELRKEVYALTGRLYGVEAGRVATPEMRVAIPRRLKEHPLESIGPYKVVSSTHFDGSKFLLENDNWALLRFSGTEPVLRIFAEADTPEKAQELVEWLGRYIE